MAFPAVWQFESNPLHRLSSQSQISRLTHIFGSRTGHPRPDTRKYTRLRMLAIPSPCHIPPIAISRCLASLRWQSPATRHRAFPRQWHSRNRVTSHNLQFSAILLPSANGNRPPPGGAGLRGNLVAVKQCGAVALNQRYTKQTKRCNAATLKQRHTVTVKH